MRKLLFTLTALALLSGPRWAYALTWNDVSYEVTSNTHLTVLRSISPIYLYSFVEGRSYGGVETRVFWYRCVSAEVGWANQIDARAKGSVIGGFTLHVDELASDIFPGLSRLGNYLCIPKSAERFWQRLYFGVYVGKNIDSDGLDSGLKTGLSFQF